MREARPEQAQGGEIDAMPKRAADARAKEDDEKARSLQTPTCPTTWVLGRSHQPGGRLSGDPIPIASC